MPEVCIQHVELAGVKPKLISSVFFVALDQCLVFADIVYELACTNKQTILYYTKKKDEAYIDFILSQYIVNLCSNKLAQ